MQITHITVSNFLGLAAFEHRLTSPVLFIGGGNGAGKSSLLEAVRFALLGETPRGVTKAGDRPTLITEGAAAGYVQVQIGDQPLRRTIGTAKFTGDAELPAHLNLCLDASRFAQMPEGERRKLLFGLASVKVDRETVAEHLRAAEIPAGVIDQVLPLLSKGFPAAASHARDQATAARGAWKATTGEAYGSQKAADWSACPEGEAPTDAELDEERAAIARHDERIVQLAEAVGRVKGAVSEEKRAELQELAEGLPQAQREQADAQDRYDAAAAEVQRLEGLARGHAPRAHTCPNCDAKLHITSDGLALAGDQPVPAADGAAALNAAKASAHDAYTELQACRKAVWHHESAKTTLENLPPAPSAEDLRAPERLQEERAKAQVHRDALALLERLRREHQKAEELTLAAARYHADVQAWVAAEKALGPDGIPAILLARALDPINERLAKHAELSGWPAASITRELALHYGGRAYNLVSESEQWRADAMFAAAIAELSTARVLLLDRFDVLEPAARGDALDWMLQLAEDETVGTVIVAGTLKAKPDLGDGIDVAWLGGARDA